MEQNLLIELTADIVAAHVANNHVSVSDVANLVQQVHSALATLSRSDHEAQKPQAKTLAVSIRASVKQDHLVCLACGKKQKTLKRHLQTAHQITPDQYRQEYGLPTDYPMTAADYSERRRGLAHAIGLGRRKQKGETASPRQRKKLKLAV